MVDSFEIKILKWEGSSNSDPLLAYTLARLQIFVNGKNLTRAQDAWSQSMVDEVYLSAYPMAMWFASSYWRLLSEVVHRQGEERSTDWKMSHSIASVGYGYSWPPITVESDGYSVEFNAIPSDVVSFDPLTYLANSREIVSSKAFIGSITQFIRLVVNRLEVKGVIDSELQLLWKDLCAEIQDPEARIYRQIEASLGSDPDSLPEEEILRIMRWSNEIGCKAALEIAKVCEPNNANNVIEQILKVDKYTGLAGSIDIALLQKIKRSSKSYVNNFPWEYGRHLAKETRRHLSISSESISNDIFQNLVGTNVTTSEEMSSNKNEFPIAFATKTDDHGGVKLHLRPRSITSRRFEMARVFADALIALGNGDRWHPITDTSTCRQKIQRAFAAEFLCPIDRLIDFMGGNYSDIMQEYAAEHFNVSPLAVRSHLANNDIIPVNAANY
jgi:hypothetical protein